jgi:hypothetical protein
VPYPPTVPPTGRVNATPQVDNHPSDHNTISTALTDIINELGPDPSGTYPTVQARLAELQARRGVTRAATNQSLPAGVTTKMVWASSSDPDGWVTNGTDIVVPSGMAGVYALTFKLSCSPAPSAMIIPSITIVASQWLGPASAVGGYTTSFTAYLPVGSVIYASAYNGGTLVNSAAELNVFRTSF